MIYHRIFKPFKIGEKIEVGKRNDLIIIGSPYYDRLARRWTSLVETIVGKIKFSLYLTNKFGKLREDIKIL